MPFDTRPQRRTAKQERLLTDLTALSGLPREAVERAVDEHRSEMSNVDALTRISACPRSRWADGSEPIREIEMTQVFDMQDTMLLADAGGDVIARMVFPPGAKGLRARRRIESFFEELEPIFHAYPGDGDNNSALRTFQRECPAINATFDGRPLAAPNPDVPRLLARGEK